jgi:hypothetical protein
MKIKTSIKAGIAKDRPAKKHAKPVPDPIIP